MVGQRLPVFLDTGIREDQVSNTKGEKTDFYVVCLTKDKLPANYAQDDSWTHLLGFGCLSRPELTDRGMRCLIL